MKESMENRSGSTGERRFARALIALILLLAAVSTASVFLGPADISPGELMSYENFPILKIRLARTFLAIAAGISLAVAGIIFQAVLRNPLADPYLLGSSGGASLGAAGLIIAGMGASVFLPLGAFLGALLAIILVYRLAKIGESVPAQTLILSGVVVGTVCSSVLLLLITFAPYQALHNAVWWLLGNLEIFDIPLLIAVCLISVSGTAAALFFSPELNLISLGEETASHLGMKVERDKKILLGIAALITGAAVSACGIIGFVGLIVPHACRMLVGPDHRRLIPAGMLAGAVFLTFSDICARLLIDSRTLPVGVITALAGGPFFLILLRKKRQAGFR